MMIPKVVIPKRYTWMGWSIALTAALGVVGGVMLPPFVGEPVREVIMQAFAGLCHQLPERSPHMNGVPLAVCDRCMGIYGGVMLGIFAFPAIQHIAERVYRHAGLVLIIVMVPLVIDWAGPAVGAWSNVPLSRAATGAVVGIVAGVLVARAAARFNQSASAGSSVPERPAPETKR